ncbi:MAG: ABC transporter ATP-binding protein [Nitrolancea sp.]
MDRPAVDDVSFDVDPGSFVVLLGPSGCGKTTLLKLINRLYDPTSGRILIDGTPIDTVSAPKLRRRIGYVVQQSGLFPHMRVEDNVAVVPKLLGWDRTRTSDRIDELLDLVGLPPHEYRRRFPAQLSGGEQQRVGLARALAANPSMLLMDEPFGALDAITRNRLQGELHSIHQRLGQTMLFVTHDVEEAVRLADVIVVMRDGKVVQHDVPGRIVLQPADDFVSSLLGSDDVLRRLSLIPVDSVLVPLDHSVPTDLPKISRTSSLRSALAQLLETDSSQLLVMDDEEEPIGIVPLEAIREHSRPGTHLNGSEHA